MRPVRCAFLVVTAALGWGCASPDQPAVSRSRADTLESGLVRIANDAEGIWPEGTRWTLEEELRLGSFGEEGPELFGDLSALIADDEGQIYVMENQAGEVRVFTPEGEFSHAIGGKGEGPGEILDSWGLNIDPDGRLWVWDVGNRRYSVFERSGEFVTSYIRQVAGVIYPWNGGFAPDGRYIDWGLHRTQNAAGVDRAVDVRTPMAFTPPDTYDTLPPLRSEPPLTMSGERKSPTKIIMVALGDDGRLWFAHTDEYTIYERTLEGDTLLAFGIPSRPEPVPDRYVDSLQAVYAEMGYPDFDRARYETNRRLVTRLLTDNAGHVFVLPNEPGVPEGTALDVFRETGEYLGRIPLPEKVEITFPPPFITSEHVYAEVYDDFDVSYVVRWRIVKPEGAVEPD